MSEHVDRILVLSTHHIKDLYPWGSHPLLDSLWSSDDVRFIHEGAHLARGEKIELIVLDEAAMRHLRVCTTNPANTYNCGRCRKCIRTTLGLALAGGLDVCETLPHALDDGPLGGLYIESENEASFTLELLDRALAVGDADIKTALRYKLWSFEARQALVRLREQARQAPMRLLASARNGRDGKKLR